MDAVITDAGRDGRGSPVPWPPSTDEVGRIERVASPVLAHLERLHARYAADRSGVVASYIPELAKADADWFGVCIATVDGAVCSEPQRRTRRLRSPAPARGVSGVGETVPPMLLNETRDEP